jgi:hypothetical protein
MTHDIQPCPLIVVLSALPCTHIFGSPPQLGAHYLQPIAELAAEFIPDADDADSVEPDTAFFFALVQGLNDCVQKLEVRDRSPP